jgi:hypothetical protein
MLSMKFTIERALSLACIGLCVCQAATVRNPKVTSPTAIAADAGVGYCFARARGLEPDRQPPAYLVLRLHVAISYRNAGTRPLILPVERKRVIFTALKPGAMGVYKDRFGLFDPVFKAMTELPVEVGPDSPVDPKNDFFTVIPAGGEMTLAEPEELTLPVDRKGVFKQYPDLRGKRVYVKLRFVHRELAAPLEANLSDRWSRFGVPWTGTLTTNTILIDVPAAPEAAPCVDSQKPAHPVDGIDDRK